ncbi:AEC family transporter, partial [Streptococcus sp.]|nr:AEC family transporter [Enterococcus faecalis]HHU64556.1 AEC family transporter [Streptococcus sp.]
MKEVFIIQSAMPVMTNAPVVAKLYGADSDYAAIMVTESTILTMVVIPILMLLLNVL